MEPDSEETEASSTAELAPSSSSAALEQLRAADQKVRNACQTTTVPSTGEAGKALSIDAERKILSACKNAGEVQHKKKNDSAAEQNQRPSSGEGEDHNRRGSTAAQLMAADQKMREAAAGVFVVVPRDQEAHMPNAEIKVLRSCKPAPGGSTDALLKKKKNVTEKYQRRASSWTEDGSGELDLLQLVNDRAVQARQTLQGANAPSDSVLGQVYEHEVPVAVMVEMPTTTISEVAQEQPGAYAEAMGSRVVRRTDSLGNFDPQDLVESGAFALDDNSGTTTPISGGSPVDDTPTEDMVEARLVQEEDETEQERKDAQPYDLKAAQERKLKRQEEQKRQLLTLVFAFCAVVMVIVGIVVGTQASKGDAEYTHASHPDMPIGESNNDSTAAPTHALDGFRGNLPEYSLESLLDPFSPQSEAFHWLQTHRGITTMEEWRMRQLFALVTFYHTLEGPSWPFGLGADWLDATRSECEWYSNLFGTFGKGGYNERIDSQRGPCNEKGKFTVFKLPGVRGGAFTIQNASMPPEVAMLTSLEVIEFNHHDLPGASLQDIFPSEFVALTKLKRLHLSRNHLTGSIPSYLWSMTQLIDLDLSKNQITGPIPTELGLLTNMTQLKLARTSLSGQIPSEIGSLSLLQSFDVASSLLSGQIPSEIGLATGMTQLSLEKNYFSKAIPSEIGLLTNLTQLDLSSNFLTGVLPKELGNCTSVHNLNLSQNAFNGTVPREWGMMISLEELLLEGAALTGGIPKEVGSLVNHNLHVLNLRNVSTLSGSIPEELCQLKQDSCSYIPPTSSSSSDSRDEDDLESCILVFECSKDLCGCDCPCL